jgi:acetolactate synthase I/III small subunit
VGLFSGRGYNIDKLHVEPTKGDPRLSRLTIVSTGTDSVIEQIKLQVDRLIPVHSVKEI